MYIGIEGVGFLQLHEYGILNKLGHVNLLRYSISSLNGLYFNLQSFKRDIFWDLKNFFLFRVYPVCFAQRRDPQCAENRTAKTLYRKFEINFSRNETARPRSQFLHSSICEQFVHSHDRSTYFAAAKWEDRWEYINRGNWERGRAVLFSGST